MGGCYVPSVLNIYFYNHILLHGIHVDHPEILSVLPLNLLSLTSSSYHRSSYHRRSSLIFRLSAPTSILIRVSNDAPPSYTPPFPPWYGAPLPLHMMLVLMQPAGVLGW